MNKTHLFNDFSPLCQRMLDSIEREIEVAKTSAIASLTIVDQDASAAFNDYRRRFAGLSVPMPFGKEPLRLIRPIDDSFSLPSSDEQSNQQDTCRELLIANPAGSSVGYYLDSVGQVFIEYESGWVHRVYVAESIRSFLERLSLFWMAQTEGWWIDGYSAPSPQATRLVVDYFGLDCVAESTDKYTLWWRNDNILAGAVPTFDRRYWLYFAVASKDAEIITKVNEIVESNIEPHIVNGRKWLPTVSVREGHSVLFVHSNDPPPIETLPAYSFRVASRDGLAACDGCRLPVNVDVDLERQLLDRWPQYLQGGSLECIYYAGMGLIASGRAELCFKETLDSVPVAGTVDWGGAFWPLCFLHLIIPNAFPISDFSRDDGLRWKQWLSENITRLAWNKRSQRYSIRETA